MQPLIRRIHPGFRRKNRAWVNVSVCVANQSIQSARKKRPSNSKEFFCLSTNQPSEEFKKNRKIVWTILNGLFIVAHEKRDLIIYFIYCGGSMADTWSVKFRIDKKKFIHIIYNIENISVTVILQNTKSFTNCQQYLIFLLQLKYLTLSKMSSKY